MTESEWLALSDPTAMLAWLQSQGPGTRAPHWPRRISDRKLRLFACACLRRSPDPLCESARAALQLAEEDAEVTPLPCRMLTHPVVAAALDIAQRAEYEVGKRDQRTCTAAANLHWQQSNRDASLRSVLDTTARLNVKPVTQAALLRDLVGNPFRPVNWWRCGRHDPPLGGTVYVPTSTDEWPKQPSFNMTPTATALAQTAYQERGRECGRCCGVGDLLLHPEGVPFSQTLASMEPCDDCHGTGRLDQHLLDPERLAILADALEDAGCTDHDLLSHLRGPGPHVRGCWALDLVLGKN